MPETIAPGLMSWPLKLTAAAIVLALAATAWLWGHYGTAVFFETVRAGFMACFG
jgi:predicted PurR-regulated permease PerM